MTDDSPPGGPSNPTPPTCYTMADMAREFKTSRTAVFRAVRHKLKLQPDLKTPTGIQFFSPAKMELVRAALPKPKPPTPALASS